MIRYALVCDRKHRFEAWFKNSADYDRQARRGLVSCPTCDSTKVEKDLMTPQLGRGARNRDPKRFPAAGGEAAADRSHVAMISPYEREVRAKLRELRDHLIKNAENVGPRFPEEARKMHYGESEHRSIYGEATPQEARELYEEGIEFHPLPILPDDRN